MPGRVNMSMVQPSTKPYCSNGLSPINFLFPKYTCIEDTLRYVWNQRMSLPKVCVNEIIIVVHFMLSTRSIIFAFFWTTFLPSSAFLFLIAQVDDAIGCDAFKATCIAIGFGFGISTGSGISIGFDVSTSFGGIGGATGCATALFLCLFARRISENNWRDLIIY